MKPLVSIIVPTFNRAQYILETLTSIKNQTYCNWECIIIDDKSTDNTRELVSIFIEGDGRFIYEIRPDFISKGANFCRNYGYKISKGSLIKFFDSDDLMLPEHLEILVDIIEIQNLDFAVGDCRNFDENGLRERPYEIDRTYAELSPINFALFQVAWITNDLLIKRKYAEQLSFAEGLLDQATEYHYNLKLLCLTNNGFLVDKVVTHRRIHSKNLIKTDLLKNRDSILAELKFSAMKYLEDYGDPELQRWFLSGFIQIGFKIASNKKWPNYTFSCVPYLVKYYSLAKASIYPFAILSGYLFGKGYNVIKYIRT